MAFKMLDNEEIALLSDSQRIQYEKELDLYQQRLAFVERLEMLENAHVEPYEPKLESIPVIDEIEVKIFKKPEYMISVCEPIVKPNFKMKTYKKAEQITPTLPLLQKRADVRTKRIQKIERTQPDLPFIIKPLVASKRFGKPQKQQPDLPKIIKPEIAVAPFKRSEKNQTNLPVVICPSIRTAVPFEQLKNNLHHTPSNMPDVVMPDIDINYIAVPVETQLNLPEVSACVVAMKTFIEPEKRGTNLPTVVKPNINMNYSKEMKSLQPDLPEISVNLSPVKAVFHKPEQRSTGLPKVSKPNITVHSLKKAERITPSLPKTSSISLQAKKFSKPEQLKLDLPTVSKLEIGVRPFVKPENKKSDLPVVVNTSIEARTFKGFERIQTNVPAPTIPSIAVKAFVTPQRNLPKLPGVNIAKVPDAYSKLKKLLLVTGKDSVVLKG